MWGWVQLQPGALRVIALSPYAQPMAESLYRMLWSWLLCFIVTIAVSLFTTPRPYDSLGGLVYGCTALPEQRRYPLVQQPVFWAIAAAFVFLWIQWLFR
jgi:SSS family solute:Na+ symporter